MDINEKSKEIQIKTEKEKIQNIENDVDFKFKLPKEIKYERKIPDNKGVFYYPLTKNFISIEEEKKFNHYYGEEYVDRVSRIDKLNKKESYLQDDILTNLIFLYLLCSKSTDNDLLKSIKSSFKMKNFSKNDVIKRIKLLYDRYHGLADEGKSEFWYMSCKTHEKKNILTLFQNNKQLYCNIDNIYDCSLHSSNDPNFDNPSCYDEIKYLKSYKKMLEYSIYYLYGENTNNNININDNNIISDNINENENNNDESCPMSLIKSDDKKGKEAGNNINNNICINNNDNGANNNDLVSNASSKIQSSNNTKENEEINSEIILENKDGSSKIIYLSKKKDEENINNINNSNNEALKNHIIELVLEFNQTLKNIKCPNNVVSQIKKIKIMTREERKPCSKLCYKNFLQCEENLYNQTFLYLNDKQFPDVYEILFIKFLQVIKFDPCHIYKLMKAFINKNNSQTENNFTINCSEIYIHLLLYKYRIKNIIKKELFDLNLKERDLSKRNNRAGITPTQSRKIEENNLRKKNITYIQCVHFGNEICDDNCPCSRRGYCEIYCKCNQILCKFAYHGCHCSKGDCTTNHCPCFMNGRECNPQKCKNCTIINNNDRCKNVQLQQNLELKLQVGLSDIAGWGLFANQDIKKDSLIGEYKGEIINDDIVNKRDKFKDYERSTYMFKLDDEYTVDSRRMGNILRYANHSKINSNSYTKIIFSGGHRKIGLFAKRNIKKGEEILFDYDGQGILGKQFPWINNEKKYINHSNINNEKNIHKESPISSENNINNPINNNINIEKNNLSEENINNNKTINNNIELFNNNNNNTNWFSRRKIKKKNLATSTITLKEDSFNKEEITNEIDNQNNKIIKENTINESKIKDNNIKDNILNKKNIKDDMVNKNILNNNIIKNDKNENIKGVNLASNLEISNNNSINSQRDKYSKDKVNIKPEYNKEKSGTNIFDMLSSKNYVTNKIHKYIFKTEEDQIKDIRNKYYKSKDNNVFNLMSKINENLSRGENRTKFISKKRNSPKLENKIQTNKLNLNISNNSNNKNILINNENIDNTIIDNIFQKDEKNIQSALFKEVKKYIDEKEDIKSEKEEKINIEIKDENIKLKMPIFDDMLGGNKNDKNSFLNKNKITYNSIDCHYYFNSIVTKQNKENNNSINQNLNNNIINNNINNNVVINNLISNNSQLKNKTINKIYNLGTIRLLLKFENPIVNDFIFFSPINTNDLKNIENLELVTENLQNNSLIIDFNKDICGYLTNNISNKSSRIFKVYLDNFENMAFKSSISEINSDLYIFSKGPVFNQIDLKYEFDNGKNKRLLFVIKKNK